MDKIRYLNNFSLNNLKNDLLKSDFFANNNEIKSGINEYKKFLFINLVNNHLNINKNRFLVPSKKVDIIWHTHILDSLSYKQLLFGLFGKYSLIYHNPLPTVLNLWPLFHNKYYLVTKKLYKLIFGYSPLHAYWLNPSDSVGTPNPTTKPSESPTYTPDPTTKPSESPTYTPDPTTKPSESPTYTPDPTTKPSESPTYTDVNPSVFMYITVQQSVYTHTNTHIYTIFYIYLFYLGSNS